MNDYQPWSHEPPHEGHAAPPRERLEFHPLADTFPMMVRAGAEFRGLVQSIKGSGLWEAITMHEGMVLDGRNRLLACEEAGVEPRFEVFDDSEMTALEFVLAKNLYRRHLTEGQKAMKAEEMVTTKHGGDRKSLIDKKEIKCSNEHLIDEKVLSPSPTPPSTGASKSRPLDAPRSCAKTRKPRQRSSLRWRPKP